jgi:hypothetical protein
VLSLSRLPESQSHPNWICLARELAPSLPHFAWVALEVVLIRVMTGNARANVPTAPTNAPRIAKSPFLYVYNNVPATMLIVWREPLAKASYVAIPDWRKLGTAMLAMNQSNSQLD